MMGLRDLFKKAVCCHEFSLDELTLTNIPELQKPIRGGYKEWSAEVEQKGRDTQRLVKHGR